MGECEQDGGLTMMRWNEVMLGGESCQSTKTLLIISYLKERSSSIWKGREDKGRRSARGSVCNGGR